MKQKNKVVFPGLINLGKEALQILFKSIFTLKQNCILLLLGFILIQLLWILPVAGLFALIGGCFCSAILLIKTFSILYNKPNIFEDALNMAMSRFWYLFGFIILSGTIILPVVSIACAFVVLLPIDFVGMIISLILKNDVSKSFLTISYIIFGFAFAAFIIPWAWLAPVAIIIDRLPLKYIYTSLALTVLKNWIKCFGYFFLLYIMPMLFILGGVGYLLRQHFIYLIPTIFAIIALSYIYVAAIQIKIYDVLRDDIHSRVKKISNQQETEMNQLQDVIS